MPAKKSAIEQITNPAIKRLSQVASINRLSASSYDDIRGILNATLHRLMKQSILYTEYVRRKTVYASDVEYALDDISYLHLFTMHKGKVKPCGQVKKVKRNNAIREIKYLQKQSDCLHISHAPFVRLIKEIGIDYRTDLVYNKNALNIIQFAIEHFLIELLYYANKIAINGDRTTVQPKDITIAYSTLKYPMK
jgi:histone H3/H4